MRHSKFSTFIDECLLKLRKKKFFRFSHYSLSDRVCWMRVIFMCRKIVYIQNTNWPFILDRLPWNETIEIWHTHRWKLAKVREKKNPKFFDSSLCNRFLNTTIIYIWKIFLHWKRELIVHFGPVNNKWETENIAHS